MLSSLRRLHKIALNPLTPWFGIETVLHNVLMKFMKYNANIKWNINLNYIFLVLSMQLLINLNIEKIISSGIYSIY